MCKKVIKVNNNEDNSYFKLMKNSLKEIEILFKINDPCICQAIGINIQEKIHHSEKKSKSKKKDDNDNDDDYEEEEDYESGSDENQLTTFALFFEYLPHSLKKCLEMNILTNTLKTKIAIEVAFGMLHIHSMGMMHRDLKIENVMLNEIFEAKIIDFGLAHDPKIAETKSSLTKGIGTFAYMSPEMLNEEKYDNKTDVYSYGIFLFVLFTGKLPKQTLKEKVANKPFKFPHHSSKISKFCIKLIKNCISVEPNQRPSFNQIIDNIAENEFKLAPELKKDIIEKRYKELNLFKSSYSK